MPSIKFKDPVTGEWAKVGIPKMDAYSKEETDNLLANIPTGMQMEQLWENASPSSEFAAQTIALDLSDYQSFIIVLRGYATSSAYFSTFVEMGTGMTNILVSTQNVAAANAKISFGQRNVTINSTGFTFNDACSKGPDGTSATTSNKYNVPYRIYGIKGVN